MQAKTERFELRLDQGTLDRLDAWRAGQSDMPSRAEAARRLMESGLAGSERRGITFSDSEKLVVMLLCEMHKALKIKDGLDPDFISESIFGGHYWGLRWKYSGLLHDYRDEDWVVTTVVDTLDMWWFIESGYRKLSPEEKARVENDCAPFGKNVRFSGFDGNNEAELLGAARFLIDKLGRFEDFKDRDLNSHMPSLEAYRRMLAVFKPMRQHLVGTELGADQIIALLQAMKYPSKRP